MKLKKILKKLIEFFDEDAQKQQQDLDALRDLLRELKLKDKELCAALEETQDADEIQKIKDQLNVISAQRSKGKTLLLKLRAEKQSS